MNNPSNTMLVTGANGLIGRWLVPALLDRGYNVIAAMRKPEQRETEYRLWIKHHTRHPVEQRLTVAEFNLEEAENSLQALAPMKQEIAAVFHLAAAFAWHLPTDHTHQINVDASDTLLHHCAQWPNLKRFVWIGGYRVASKPNVSDAQLYRKLGAYEASKLIAYDRLKTQAHNLKVPWTSVNPSTVIGHSQTGQTTQLIGLAEMVQQLKQGKLPWVPGSPSTFIPLVHVDFVAEFTARLLDHPESINKEYWLLDENTPKLMPLLQRIAQHFGVKAPRGHVPVWLLKALPSMMLPSSKETLSFLSSDRYPVACTQSLARKMGIAHLLTLNNVEAWADNVATQEAFTTQFSPYSLPT